MSELTILKQPIALRQEHIATKTTALRLKCTSRVGGDYAVSAVPTGHSSSSDPSESDLLFKIDGNITSWSQRRFFRDASGLPLFELYRKSAGVTWFVGIPGGKSEQPLATLAPRWNMLKDKCDMYVANAAAGGDEAVLAVRGQDVWKRWTHVYADDNNNAMVMRVKLANIMAVYLPGKLITWDIEVAEGMDLSLVNAIMLVRCSFIIGLRLTYVPGCSYWGFSGRKSVQ